MPPGVLISFGGIGVFTPGEPEVQPVDCGFLDTNDLLRILGCVRGMLVHPRHHVHLGRLMEMTQATVNFPFANDLGDARGLACYK